MGLCAPGEKHELALLMQSHVLRLAGWRTVYLGTQVPFGDLLEAMRKYKPDILGISITMDENVPGLELYLRQIDTLYSGKLAIILGGRGAALIDAGRFPRVHSGAHTLSEGVNLAEHVVLGS